MMMVIYLVLMILSSNPGVQAFNPNHAGSVFSIPSTFMTHDDITKEAVRLMAVEYMDTYPALYPDQIAALSTSDFRTARDRILDGASSPDNFASSSGSPEIHFDSEMIAEANTRMIELRQQVVGLISLNSMDPARHTAGQLLHTLQDFYSHSNWIELGNTDIHYALGDPNEVASIGSMAAANDPTCIDCTGLSCPNNILSNILTNDILTSGYWQDKPEQLQKCSHGGLEDTKSITVSATGGINKDTDSSVFSPHHDLHSQAADLATKASLEFLRQLRSTRTEDEFARFLGLQVGASLCFVVDTTGSMGEEIASVRTTTIDITLNRAGSLQTPSEYILVPFNDPDFGPVFQTTNSQEMIAELGDLTADGGGDEPEMAFSGLNLALQAVRPGSECYLFTDASAKDFNLLSLSQSLIATKNVQVNIMLTGFDGLVKRRKRDTTHSRHRVKRDAAPSYYQAIARASGGLYINVDKVNIGEILKVVDTRLSTIKVTILKIDDVVGDGLQRDITIPVDKTLTKLGISVFSSEAITTFRVLDPSGEPDLDGVTLTQIDNLVLYTIAFPSAGDWTIQITTFGSFSVEVTADSLLDFNFEFVEFVNFGHPGFRKRQGRPLGDTENIMLVRVSGGISPLPGSSEGMGLAKVTKILLVTESGNQLQQLEPNAIEEFTRYETSVILPTEAFRVVLEGSDTTGQKLQRWSTTTITTAKSTVNVETNSQIFFIRAGETIEVQVKITNYGSSGTFSLTAIDTENFSVTVTPESLFLDTDEQGFASVISEAPLNAIFGQQSFVSVVAEKTDGTDQNYVVYRVAVQRETIDETLPTCDIVRNIGNCSQTISGHTACDNESWFFEFVAQDKELGLHAIKPDKIYTTSELQVENFDAGTNAFVEGNYTSSCCNLRIRIVASDVLGNFAACDVDLTPPPLPTPTLSNDSTLYVTLIVAFGALVMLLTRVLFAKLGGDKFGPASNNNVPRPNTQQSGIPEQFFSRGVYGKTVFSR